MVLGALEIIRIVLWVRDRTGDIPVPRMIWERGTVGRGQRGGRPEWGRGI